MHPLLTRKSLKNTYIVLRHGKSKAAEEEIIISNPREGTMKYGLVEEGKEEVRNTITKALQEKLLDKNTIILSSDFTRAKETAQIAQEILQANKRQLSIKLRERFFGNFDKTHKSNYKKVWADDLTYFNHKNNGVESTEEVLTRLLSLIHDTEKMYTEKNILLVSHGDALQILQTAFECIPSSHHRTLPPIETGELRVLIKK